MPSSVSRELQQLCEQAVGEYDTRKLIELSRRISDLLDKEQSAKEDRAASDQLGGRDG